MELGSFLNFPLGNQRKPDLRGDSLGVRSSNSVKPYLIIIIYSVILIIIITEASKFFELIRRSQESSKLIIEENLTTYSNSLVPPYKI